jgi:hypothetical protein
MALPPSASEQERSPANSRARLVHPAQSKKPFQPMDVVEPILDIGVANQGLELRPRYRPARQGRPADGNRRSCLAMTGRLPHVRLSRRRSTVRPLDAGLSGDADSLQW